MKIIICIFADASLSDMSRTGSPHGHHADSDSEDMDVPSRNKRFDDHRDRDQRSSHSSAAGSTMSPGVPASLASLHTSGGLLSAQPSTVSLGPPLPPPPHLLPYLYPSGLYPGGPSLHQLSQLLHTPPGLLGHGAASALSASGHAAMSHNLLLNAQLALAAQHQLFHPHAYQNLSAATLSAVAAAASGVGSGGNNGASVGGGAVSPPSTSVHPATPTSSLGPAVNERLRPHRFAPYTLGATSPAATSTASATPNPSPLVGSGNSSAFETVSPKPSPLSAHRLEPSPPVLLPPPLPSALPSLELAPPPSSVPPSTTSTSSPASDLKNMEKMVNGLEMSKVADSTNSAIHHPTHETASGKSSGDK